MQEEGEEGRRSREERARAYDTRKYFFHLCECARMSARERIIVKEQKTQFHKCMNTRMGVKEKERKMGKRGEEQL